MTKQEIIDKLNNNRRETLKRNNKSKEEYLMTMQVATADSDLFYTFLSLVRTEDKKYYSVLHNSRNKVNAGVKNNQQRVNITPIVAATIFEGYTFYKENRSYHLNPYSALMSYCLLHGVDLVREGVIIL